MTKKKQPRRYGVTARKGITGRIYIKPSHHKALPPVVKIYTKAEIKVLEKTMDLRIPKKP